MTEPTAAETVRGRVAGALADVRLSLKDVWREVEKDGTVCSYTMVGAVARGGALGEGPKDSPKANRVRAVIAALTGKTVEWLFMTDKENESGIVIDSGGSGLGAPK